MEISPPNVRSSPEQDQRAFDIRFQQRLERRFSELKVAIAERPFLYAGMAFVAGFIANTLPAKLLFVFLARLTSWLVGPTILLIGVLKLSDSLFSTRQNEPIVLHRP